MRYGSNWELWETVQYICIVLYVGLDKFHFWTHNYSLFTFFTVDHGSDLSYQFQSRLAWSIKTFIVQVNNRYCLKVIRKVRPDICLSSLILSHFSFPFICDVGRNCNLIISYAFQKVSTAVTWHTNFFRKLFSNIQCRSKTLQPGYLLARR